MSKYLVIGNWKMYTSSLDQAKEIIKKNRVAAGELRRTDVVACPPFVFIHALASKSESTLKIGAQSVSIHETGAHTGEVSAPMLRDSGVTHVIVGHSETRAAGDTDANIALRLKAVLEAGMYGVLCVGEQVRDEDGAYLDTLKAQIHASLANIPANLAKHIVLAYEPVWAIGAKEAMVPDQIYEMSLFVKKVFADVFSQDQAMKVTVLYGGSVNAMNAADIVKIGQVDGLLVGRESVNPTGFSELLKVVDGVS